MKAPRSLRVRFLLAFGLFGAILTAAFGKIAWRSVHIAEDTVIQRWLAAETDEAVARRAADSSAPLPSGYFIHSTIDPAGLPAELRDRAPSLPDGPHDLRGEGKSWQLNIRALPDGRRLYVYLNESDVEGSDEHEGTVQLVRVLLCVLVGLVGLLLGWLTTRRIIAPLRRLTEAVAAHQPEAAPPDLQRLVSKDELGVLAEQLEQALARVAASARQEQLFGRYTSHELRSSLAVASGVAELLSDLGDPRLARPLARLERATEDMGAIIETCLWLARSHGRMPDSETVALRPLAEDLVGPLQRRVDGGVELVIDVAPDAVAEAPRLALRMILNNLLTNAARHTVAGRIVLVADRDSVAVRDTGPGIAPEILSRIMEPYVRGPGEGHGLGLSIVHGLCQRLGWRLDVESVVGQGTTARVVLAGQKRE